MLLGTHGSPMDKKFFFTLWFFLSFITGLIVLAIRYRRTKTFNLELSETIRLAISGIFGFLSGLQIFWIIAQKFDALEPIISVEGCVFLCIGGFAVIWFALSEIITIAKK
jgi:hypothetical protein